jgi:hypothetical protein
MVTKAKPKAGGKPPKQSESPPVIVRCILQLPRDKADALLPHLGIAIDCGGAEIRRRGKVVEVETDLEIGRIADIVEMGVPVLVTKRLKIRPIAKESLIHDAAAWFRHVGDVK